MGKLVTAILVCCMCSLACFPQISYCDQSSEPFHPCLSAGIKKSVVFIGALKPKENSKNEYERVYFGTGFILQIDQIFYLVTAKHVVEGFRSEGGRDDQLFTFLNGSDGKIREQSLGQLQRMLGIKWIMGKASDITILPFGIQQDFDVKVIPENMFLESSQFLELQDLFFISFQPGIHTTDMITPVTRRGMVSVLNPDMTFYMDAFAFPGNSGSPVFIKPSPAVFMRGGTGFGDPHACQFVGLIGEYLPYQEIAVSLKTKRPRIVFEENTGLARVWPVQALRSLLLSVDFQSQHKKLKEKLPAIK